MEIFEEDAADRLPGLSRCCRQRESRDVDAQALNPGDMVSEDSQEVLPSQEPHAVVEEGESHCDGDSFKAHFANCCRDVFPSTPEGEQKVPQDAKEDGDKQDFKALPTDEVFVKLRFIERCFFHTLMLYLFPLPFCNQGLGNSQ